MLNQVFTPLTLNREQSPSDINRLAQTNQPNESKKAMPPEALRILRALQAQNRHRDCAALALRCLASVDGEADRDAPTDTETAAGADVEAAAEPLHRAALALHAGLALDALARAAPLRSAAAAARAGRAARLLAGAAAGLRAAYGLGDGGDGGGRREGGDGEGGEPRTGGRTAGEAAAADALRWRARVERFRRGVGGLVGTLEALARSAERWRNEVLDWQERHGVVVSGEELAAAARDLHGSLW
jgi:hypothetical protein